MPRESIFIDTGPFFEFVAAQDRVRFLKTKDLFASDQFHLYSSSYIFDELMTLLLQRVEKKKVITVGEGLRESSLIHWISPSIEDEEGCWQIFKTYTDKKWSYTDCMSFFLIQKLKIKFVLSFDHHFEQMGYTLL